MSLPEKQPLFRGEVLEAQQSQWLGTVLLAPRLSFRLFTGFAVTAAAAMLAFLFLGDYTDRAVVDGWLVPEDGLVRVYAPITGTITELQVHEGELVAKDAILAKISTEIRSETMLATRQEVVLRLISRRDSLVAERGRRERLYTEQLAGLEARLAGARAALEQVAAEITLQQRRLAVAERSFARYQGLHDSQLMPATRLDEADEERLEQALQLASLERSRTELEQALAGIERDLSKLPLEHQTELGTIDREIAALEQDIAEAEARREIILTAPVPGIVTGLQVEAGSGVAAAAPVLSLVPEAAALQAELFAPGRAIGFVREGQSVLLRYAAFPYQKFGFYRGTVTSISRAAVNPAEFSSTIAGLTSLYDAGEPVYRIRVALDQQTVTAYGEAMPLQAGLAVEADILLENRRLIEWVLDPLYTLTGRS
jgi:membrane fusion protein